MNALVSLTVIIVGCILATGLLTLYHEARAVAKTPRPHRHAITALTRPSRGCGSIMHNDLDGRRCLGAAVLYVPDGNEVAPFRSPRKLARAIIHGAVIPVDGDTVVVGKHVVVS
jgi:hypothetical protein